MTENKCMFVQVATGIYIDVIFCCISDKEATENTKLWDLYY